LLVPPPGARGATGALARKLSRAPGTIVSIHRISPENRDGDLSPILVNDA
jgi:hypothetical protein